MSNKKSAFTLIELAVVLVLIMMLVGGLMKASNMVAASRLANARAITANSIVPKIDGLVAWYDSSSMSSFNTEETYDGAQLTEWFDISPLSIVEEKNVLTKSASSTVVFKESGINSLPTISFSGGNFTLTSFYQGEFATSTFFLVFQPSTVGGTTDFITDSYSSDNDVKIGIKNSAVRLSAGTIYDISTSDVTVGNDFILSAYFSSTTSSRAYLNDAENTIDGSSNTTGTNPLISLTVGSKKNGDDIYRGYLSEIIIYNRLLKKQERKDVMKYLSTKYQVSIGNL